MPQPIQAKQINTTTGAISTVNAGDSAAEGTAAGVSRRDHEHAVATGGTTDQIQATNAAAEGTSTNLAREDHVHEIDITNGTISTINAGDSMSEGSGTGVSRRDHQHPVATAAAVTVEGATNSAGVSTSLSRADHQHRLEVDVLDGGVSTSQRPALNFIDGLGIGITVVDNGGSERADITIASTLGAGAPVQEAVTTQAVSTDTALTDTLDSTPVSNASVSLYLNGVMQRQGAGNDYSISGTTITWLAGTGTAVDMETTDTLDALYES